MSVTFTLAEIESKIADLNDSLDEANATFVLARVELTFWEKMHASVTDGIPVDAISLDEVKDVTGAVKQHMQRMTEPESVPVEEPEPETEVEPTDAQQTGEL